MRIRLTHILLITLLLSGCASLAPQQEFQHFCVPNSIRDAWTWEIKTGRPARIAISSLKPGTDHAQAQGQEPDGSWVYLTTHNSDGILRKWKRHFDVEPYMYWTLDEFVKRQAEVRNWHIK